MEFKSKYSPEVPGYILVTNDKDSPKEAVIKFVMESSGCKRDEILIMENLIDNGIDSYFVPEKYRDNVLRMKKRVMEIVELMKNHIMDDMLEDMPPNTKSH